MSNKTEVGQIKKFFCTECNGNRNCKIEGYHIESYPGFYQFWDEFYILKCQGCDFCFLMKETTTEDDLELDDETGEFYSKGTRQYFPPQFKREMPAWLKNWHAEVESTKDLFELFNSMNEIYIALNNNLLTFASIGIRTTFDIASEYLGVSTHLPFQDKVKELQKKGMLREGEEESINLLIETGNASAHRGWKPNNDELDTVIGILEDFVHREIFKAQLLAKRKEKENELKKRIPKRSKKPKQQDTRSVEKPSSAEDTSAQEVN